MRTLALVSVALAAASLGCGTTDDAKASGPRVIVLGFDGMDYAFTKQLMDAGRMPNFSKVAKTGSFAPLETSIPPQSPVAWSDFITGMDSGGHGIYDFVHRDPLTLAPYSSTSRPIEGGQPFTIGGKYQIPPLGGGIELLRRGRAFWEVLEDRGIQTTIVRMPANYPPSGTASYELSGMGTTDIKGSYGEFSFYTSKLFAFAGEDISGGDVHEVDIFDGVVDAELYGPDNPFLQKREKLTSEFTAYLDPVDPIVKIVAGAEEVILKEGEFSDWIPVEFPMIPTQTLPGMVRFYLRAVRPDFELYVTPVNFDPMNPAAQISTPEDYAAELARATGRFYTQGMPEDTKAVEQGIIDFDEFLQQSEIAGREIVEQYHHVLEQFDDGLLFYYTGNVDQTSHVMWGRTLDPTHPAYDLGEDSRYATVIEDLYVGLDELVGYTLENMGDNTTLVVMSDHGFASWTRAFDLNAWLKEHGYLVVKNPDMKNDPGMFANVDWSQTRAYGLGINGLYVNLRGREKNGIVTESERAALVDEIAAALLAEIDPATELPAVTKVYKKDEVFADRGEIEIGPDIVVGYAKGTRGSGRSALGGVGKEVFTDNTDDWSGDHLMDHEAVPGVLLTSRALKKPAPRLQDLAAAILAEFGVDTPINPSVTQPPTDE
jgi:predicted AlkP superfamily phosphohydrolase/phosphomutase